VVLVNTNYGTFVPSNADISAFVSFSGVKPVGLTTNDESVSFSSFSVTKTGTNSTPAPSPTPSTGATVSVTGYPAPDPAYSSCKSVNTDVVIYFVGAVVLTYGIGRVEQFVRDARRTLGSGQGNRD